MMQRRAFAGALWAVATWSLGYAFFSYLVSDAPTARVSGVIAAWWATAYVARINATPASATLPLGAASWSLFVAASFFWKTHFVHDVCVDV